MENEEWRMENEGRGAENRSSRRLARETWSALAILALGLTILGVDKSPATRALQRFLSRGRTDAVTSAEIACGYRVTGTDAGGWSVGDISWTIPVVWREPSDFSVSRGYQNLSTERQMFTIDAEGTVGVEKFNRRVARPVGGTAFGSEIP